MTRRFVLPGPDVGRLLLDRLVAEGVRYGRDFALVRIVVPLGTADGIAPMLADCLRDAVLIPAGTPRGTRNPTDTEAAFAMISVKVEDPMAESVPVEGFWPTG